MTLYLIGGLPGSGKSTLARELTETYTEADLYFMRDPNNPQWNDDDAADRGVYQFDPCRLSEAHAWCQRMTERLMSQKHECVAVANTFTRHWEREPYRALARKYGYQVVWIKVETDLTDEELAARNVHGVPAEAIARMRARWED